MGRKSNRVTFNCEWCNKEKTVKKSVYDKAKHHFCCKECYDKWQSENLKGENNPNYGNHKLSGENNPFYGKHHTDETKKKLSEIRKQTPKENNGMLGKHHSEETKKKMSEAKKGMYIGENNPNWNPNITDEEREDGRYIKKYDEFIKQVYERDNYTCQCCGQHGGNLNAHHLNGYNWDKENRVNVDNGITLCKDCHSKFHKIYGKGNNTLEQFIEFIQAQNYSHLIEYLNQIYFKLNYNKIS